MSPLRPLLLALAALACTAPALAISCGALIPDVFAGCGHPDFSKKEPCCRALRKWNAAGCWCDPLAFRVLVYASGDGYAFGGRVGACSITRPLRPHQPFRGVPTKPGTCPESLLKSLPPGAAGEKDFWMKACPNPADLRARRMSTISQLNAINLTSSSKADVTAFKNHLVSLFVTNVSFVDVGQLLLHGIDDVTDFFLSRQSALGSPVPWVRNSTMGELLWTSPATVSYSLRLETCCASGARYMFLEFVPCSEKLKGLYSAEQDYIGEQYPQFYYSKGPEDLLSQYEVSPLDLCKRIQENCGSSSPYKSLAACKSFMTTLKKSKKVLCNKFKQAFVPQRALHGNSMGCRDSYSRVAIVDPKKYCPLLGEAPTGRCAERECPGGLYADMFTEPSEQRHSGGGGGFCAVNMEVVEDWPNKNSDRNCN